MQINKETKLYGSFSLNAGNNGCKFFNEYFKIYNINAIYRSFSIGNIYDALLAAKTLKFSGCGISMPFKVTACEYVDELDTTVERCGSLNTIIFKDDKMIGFNTDFVAAYRMLGIYNPDNEPVYILGSGGLSKSYQAACIERKVKFVILNRQMINNVFKYTDKIIFNCTPVDLDVKNNTYIDCLVDTPTGHEFFVYQAREQFKLYTGYELPIA
jgi:shikimate dehydrogenase